MAKEMVTKMDSFKWLRDQLLTDPWNISIVEAAGGR